MEPAHRCEIIVRGALDPSWSDWLGGMAVRPMGELTTIAGAVADQPALRGILCRLWDLHLTVLLVRVIEGEAGDTDPARASGEASSR